MIVALSGRKGSGKSALSDAFEATCKGSVTRLSFAEPLKEALKPLFLFTDEQLYGSEKETVDPRWGVSPRWVMQHLATDFLREQVDEAFFLKHMDLRLKASAGDNVVLIDDVRFENEQQLLKKHGALLIHVMRDGGEKDGHSSENSLDMDLIDVILKNDGTVATLLHSLNAYINARDK